MMSGLQSVAKIWCGRAPATCVCVHWADL